MMFKQQQKSELQNKGQSLDERIAAGFCNAESKHLNDGLKVALRYWQQCYQQRKPDGFITRLAWDNLDPASLEAALTSSAQGESDWPEQLAALLHTEHTPEKTASDRSTPFSELFETTADRLSASLQLPQQPVIAATAIAQLREELLMGLSRLAAATLFPRYREWRRHGGYLAFIQHMAKTGMADHCLRYPVLARRLVWLADSWQSRTQALLHHLQADWPQILQRFELQADARVQALELGLSERHDGGRQVVGLHFSDGTRVIYKPRAVALEAAWNHLLDWLKEHGCDCVPASLKVVDGGDRGWFEFADSVTASSPAAVEDFARRAGALACLAWLFNASDLHSENVVATARGPCLIDAETLLQPQAASTSQQSAMARANARVVDSCLASGLLHFPVEAEHGRVIDHSGLLGVSADQAPARATPRWLGVGSDQLALQQVNVAAPATRHRLRDQHGQAVDLSCHLSAVVEGFQAMWRFLADNRQALEASEGPLAAFKAVATRVVMRPSNVYAQLQQQLLQEPKLQTHGALPGMLIDTINRHFPLQATPPNLWPLVAEERRQLEQLDIPVARSNTDSTDLHIGQASVRKHFSASGLTILQQRLDMLGEHHALENQLHLLRSACSAPGHAPCIDERRHQPLADPIDDEQLLTLAKSLGNDLLDNAIRGESEGLTWLAPAYLRTQDRNDRGSSYYLYDGASGIAVFLAALARQTGDENYRQAALDAMKPVWMAFASRDAEVLLRHEGIGACNGLGSLILACLHLEQLTGEKLALDLAETVASRLDADRISRDRRLDVEGGAAGAVFALLALYQRSPDPRWLSRAEQACNHLLASRKNNRLGTAWPNHSGLLQTGLAHGASGIAAALARFHSLRPRTDILQAVRQAVEYEHALFDASGGNWPVLLQGSDNSVQQRFMLAWCNGAPGIAVARMLLRRYLPELDTGDDLPLAMASTRRAGRGAVDHLCCGAAGLADVLLQHGLWYQQPEDAALGRRLLSDIAHRKLVMGQDLLLHPDPEHNRCFRPGLFRGIAGIGYTALRCLDPQLAALTLPGECPVILEQAA